MFGRIMLLRASLCLPLVSAAMVSAQPGRNLHIVGTRELKIDGATLQVDFAEGQLDLSQEAVLAHIRAAASAVTAYYGSFPVVRDRILIVPVPGKQGIGQGTTWGNMAGFPAMTRIHIGQHATEQDLKDDWMMTHELVHTGFPNLPDDQHWMEEGLAVYVEPLARVMTGELTAQKVWHDMVRDMHQGEPQAGDQGVDQTHTLGTHLLGRRAVLPGGGCGDSARHQQSQGAAGRAACHRHARRDDRPRLGSAPSPLDRR